MKQRSFRLVPLLLLLSAGLLSVARAEVKLPRVFGSHMVLQQGQPLQFWGWADPNETVEVTIGTQSAKAQANARGEWRVTLPAMKAGGPHEVTVKGSSTVRLEDVLVGEVWLCSGQSNMEMGVATIQNGKEEVAAANYPKIRLLMVPNRWTPQPQSDIESGSWKVCSPETIAADGWGGFSASGFFFGRELHKTLGVPVGLIDATWGGTCAQSWTPPEGFAAVPELQNEYERVQLAAPGTPSNEARLGRFLGEVETWLTAAREAKAKQAVVPPMPNYPAELLPPRDVQHATALYNGMIHPLQPFAIRGAIWYQGEANLGDGMVYAHRMAALIRGWRTVWGQGEFPFFFVQIAPFNYGGDPERLAVLWDAQVTAARSIPNSGLAVINDIGDLKDIHPANKQEVGRRLALLALGKTYGSNVVYSGPTLKEAKPEGNQLRLTFENTAGGLRSRDGKPLNWFEIIDADEGGFVAATAQIDGDSILLASPEVKRPVAARFAWSMFAEPNLANGAGLPASAFRAGDLPKRDLLAMRVPEAKQYTLVYDLDLKKLGNEINYTADKRNEVKGSFDRVAYFMELTGQNGNVDFVYVSMDAFTDLLAKIGVPTKASGAHFQQKVAALNVISNVRGVSAGTNLNGGYIEFWPNNYGTANSAGVPNASGSVYDFGDQPSEPADGYGSMQVHNAEAKQVLFALNHWREGNGADLGIGNQGKDHPDWTFTGNAGGYKAGRLRVFVRTR